MKTMLRLQKIAFRTRGLPALAFPPISPQHARISLRQAFPVLKSAVNTPNKTSPLSTAVPRMTTQAIDNYAAGNILHSIPPSPFRSTRTVNLTSPISKNPLARGPLNIIRSRPCSNCSSPQQNRSQQEGKLTITRDKMWMVAWGGYLILLGLGIHHISNDFLFGAYVWMGFWVILLH